MSRRIGPKLKRVILKPLTRAFLLVKLGPFYDDTYLRESTDTTDTLFDGENYTCAATIISLDTPTITSGVDKGAYNLSFIDKDYWFRNKFVHGVTGTKAEVRTIFIDVDGEFDEDQPLLEPENTMIIYKGTINNYSYTISKESPPIVSIELASPMGALSLVRSIVTSQNWMRQKYPEDNSYDNISDGSRQITLLWGKA
jgi:hypothetical protein